MIEDMPGFVNWLFLLTTLLTLILFLKVVPDYKPILIIMLVWIIIQGSVGFSGFYTQTDTFPPRFALLILPPLLVIAVLFLSSKGTSYIDRLDLQWLTYLHIVRIPVEITLFRLFLNGKVPELMTFEGRNYDIVSGLTAPFIAYFGYAKPVLGKTVVLIWNFLCLGLLFNIVLNAVLSLPTPFQQFAFDQPNVALLYFPYIWLPCFIVPVVLFAHLASIRKLLNTRN